MANVVGSWNRAVIKKVYLGEISDPTAIIDKGALYTKDVGPPTNKTELFYIDGDGSITQITGAGTLLHSLDQAYDDGSAIAVDNTDVVWTVTDTKTCEWNEIGGDTIFKISALVAGDEVQMGSATNSITFKKFGDMYIYDGTTQRVKIDHSSGDIEMGVANVTDGGNINFYDSREPNPPVILDRVALRCYDPTTGVRRAKYSTHLELGSTTYSAEWFKVFGDASGHLAFFIDPATNYSVTIGSNGLPATPNLSIVEHTAGNTTFKIEGSTGVVELYETTKPSGLANVGKIYTKEVTGVTELHYVDSAGTETQITGGGTLTHSLDAAYDDGSTIAVDNTNVVWTVTDTKTCEWHESGGDVILRVSALVAGDEVQIGSGTNATDLELYGNLNMHSDITGVVNIIRDGGDLTIQTTTSGNLVLNPFGDIACSTKNFTGIGTNMTATGALTVTSTGANDITLTSGNDIVLNPSGGYTKSTYHVEISPNYNLYLSGTDHRQYIFFDSVTPAFVIKSTTGAYGTPPMVLETDGDLVLKPNTQVAIQDKPIKWATDGGGDIGADGATRPDSIYAKTRCKVGSSLTLTTDTITGNGKVDISAGATSRISTSVGDVELYPTGQITIGNKAIKWASDGGGNIGADGANRPDYVYVKTQCKVGSSVTIDTNNVTIPSTGKLYYGNNYIEYVTSEFVFRDNIGAVEDIKIDGLTMSGALGGATTGSFGTSVTTPKLTSPGAGIDFDTKNITNLGTGITASAGLTISTGALADLILSPGGDVDLNSNAVKGITSINTGLTLDANGKPTLTGTGRQSTTIGRRPEYDGGVPSARDTRGGVASGSNAVTVTIGQIGGLVAGQGYHHNYYNVTANIDNQDININVKIRLPDDFDGFRGASPFKIWTHATDITGNNAITATLVGGTGTKDSTLDTVSILPSVINTYEQKSSAIGTTYSAGEDITLELHITVDTGDKLRVAEIELDYYSKF